MPMQRFAGPSNEGGNDMYSGRWASLAALMLLFISGTARSVRAVEPTYPDLVYGAVGQQPLHLDIYLPTTGKGPFPVVLHIHGGGWFLGERYPIEPYMEPLLDNGIAIASVQYRLTGHRQEFGDDLTFPAQIHDLKGAVRWLRANAGTYNLDPTRIGAWGSSAGGHLAALLGTSGDVKRLEGDIGGNLEYSSRVQAAANYYGPCDILNEALDITDPPGGEDHDYYFSTRSRLIGWSQQGQGIGDIRANQNNPDVPYPTLVALTVDAGSLAHVSADDPPFFIGHGTLDFDVPVAQAQKLNDALVAAGVDVELHIVPGAVHDDLPQSVHDALIAWFVNVLADDPTGPGAPALISAAAASDTQIDLTWTAGSDPETGVAEYIIYRDGAAIDRVAGSALSYSDTGLDALTSYSYTVAAVNGQMAESAPSNAVAAQTLDDVIGPTVQSVYAAGVPTQVRVEFNELVDSASAESTFNYTIAPDVFVSNATLQSDNRTVVLTTSALDTETAYTLSVSDVNPPGRGGDGGSNPIVVPFTYSPRVRDGLIAEYDFEQGSGDTVADVSGAGTPMDLWIDDPASTTWVTGGLRLDAPTLVRSPFWASKIVDACTATNAITVEAWVKPANVTQDGPVRMVTMSSVEYQRNFTLGPGTTEWVWLVRTTQTDTNGVPLNTTGFGFVTTDLQHVVATFDSSDGRSRIYLNGQQVNWENIGGDLSDWAHGMRFALGNELLDSWPWLGTFYHVAVYDRALSAADIQINFGAGPGPVEPDPPCPADVTGDDTVDVFDLFELLGNWGADAAGADLAPPTDVVNVQDLFELLAAWGPCG